MNVGEVVEEAGKKYVSCSCLDDGAYLCAKCAVFVNHECNSETLGNQCFNVDEELYFLEV